MGPGPDPQGEVAIFFGGGGAASSGYSAKYVIVFNPLLTVHVIRCMRSGRVRIFNGNQWETL